MKLKNSVLLLKTQSSENSIDKYEQLLLENGFIVTQVKTLIFEYKNIATLAQKLKENNCYSGIIFSSPRCVQAVNLASKNEKVDLSSWKSKNNFAVGQATFTAALEKLELECRGEDSGSAINLIKYMIEGKQQYTKPFLYPHGNLKSDTISKDGADQGLQVDDILVYDTVNNPKIEDELRDVLNNFTEIPEFIVFFSPSGLNSSLEHLKKIPDFDLAKLVAIGPTTESAMKTAQLPVFGVAKQPNPQNILDILVSK